MSAPFIFDKYVTGKNFIGRAEDCKVLSNLLSGGEHVAIYEPAKSGKKSILQQCFFNMKMSGKQFVVGEFTVLNLRSITDFLLRYGTTAVRAVASTPTEYESVIRSFLPGTHFVFDRKMYSETDQVVSANWDLDEADMVSMLRLPHLLGKAYGQHIYMDISEFQNISLFDNGEKLLKGLEAVIKETKGAGLPSCSYIFVGSMVNAMKEIFEHRHFFYRLVEHLPLREVEEKLIVEHVVKGLLSGGKVVERELLVSLCKLLRNNMWYINHFVAICDALSRGYIVETQMNNALHELVAIHEPRFMAMMNSLTTFQLSLLRAMLEGNVKFSAAEVIRKYQLNSSANVKRVKDALTKKEIITFGPNDEPRFLDPLFEYWTKQYFFNIK